MDLTSIKIGLHLCNLTSVGEIKWFEEPMIKPMI